MFYFFKKGDNVPVWIEQGKNTKSIKFGTDVMVHKTDEEVHIYPFEENPEYCIHVVAEKTGMPVELIGAPTIVYKNISYFIQSEEEAPK